MSNFKPFSIPIKAMLIGQRNFQFKVQSWFFEEFENSLIDKGQFEVDLEVDKQSSLITFSFDISGSFEAICDRCTNNIHLPIVVDDRVLVKYDDEGRVDDEVVYISRDQNEFNVAQLIYEVIHLNIPISNTKDCESEEFKDCNQKVLNKLNQTEEEGVEEKGNDIWSELKNIKLN